MPSSDCLGIAMDRTVGCAAEGCHRYAKRDGSVGSVGAGCCFGASFVGRGRLTFTMFSPPTTFSSDDR